MNRRLAPVAWALVAIAIVSMTTPMSGLSWPGFFDFSSFEWTRIRTHAPWAARAGLQVVELHNRLYLMGGRTPLPPSNPPVPGASQIWGDVWVSRDGRRWAPLLETDDAGHWPARAYFQAVTKGPFMYVLGGQNFKVVPNPGCAFVPPGTPCPPFVSQSDFFNDVWRSHDGRHWTPMTKAAPWKGRAGLSAVVLKDEIFVFGGSQNDDDAIIGGPPQRIYFNDVWKSRDGRTWEIVTGAAPWLPRAGAATVVKNGYIYLLGGENGFLCQPFPGCTLPYFNDVWRTRDGANWEPVTLSADWSPRPGHQAVVLLDRIVLFGGFGLPVNPTDMWESRDGSVWDEVDGAPWNALSPQAIKYDFDALAVYGGPGQPGPAILTFGGDRETFDFADPTNYLNVDNDVWRFGWKKPGDH